MRAIGFHGTSAEAARRILSSGFEVSRNEYDWLGDGAYFFQDAPARALEWAQQRFGGDAAVLGAEIDLEDCIDFLDVEWQGEVTRAYERYRVLLEQEGYPLPRQTRGAHRLDRSVINYLVALLSDRGIRVKSVRAAFGRDCRCSRILPCSTAHTSRSPSWIRQRSCAPGAWLERRLAMLDPKVAGKIWQEHFDTVTRDEFVARVQRVSPDLARELWGERSVAEICAEPPRSVHRGMHGVFSSLGRSVLRLFS